MAKKYYKAPVHQTGTSITTKTHFGSTNDMVVDHKNYSISLNDNQVLCKDDRGFYITLKNRIDSGLADPNRYSNIDSRISIAEKSKELDSILPT